MPAPSPEHVPANDGRELHGPDEARRQPCAGRFMERGPEQVPALVERVGDRDEDALAVDEQVREVKGDEVTQSDRQEARADRAHPDRPRDREGHQDDDAEERDEQNGLREEPGRPEDVEERLCLREAVEDDRGDAERDERHVGSAPASFEKPAPERARVDPPVFVHEAPVCEAAEKAEPDRERLTLRPPLVAPELGHHRDRQRRVSDEHDEQDRRTGLDDELEPDEEREACRRRPAADRGGIGGDIPALDVQGAQDGGADVVDRRERVEEVPRGPDDRAHDREPDPAINPQEQGRNVSVARPAGDALSDDPRPANEPENQQGPADPGRRQMTGGGQVGRRGAYITDDDEDERQGDRDGRPDDIDCEGEPARIGRIHAVRRDTCGYREGDDRRRREGACNSGGPCRDCAPGAADHAWSVGRLRRVSRYAAPAPSTISATMIGRMTSPLLPAAVPSPEGDGAGATVGTGVPVTGVGLALAVAEEGATAVGAGVATMATVNVHFACAMSPSPASVVDSTVYAPLPSGLVGVATIRVSSSGSTDPFATWVPLASFTTRLLPSGFIASL